MKTTIKPMFTVTATVLFTMLFNTVAFAQKGPRGGERGHSLAQKFESVDSNVDGQISLDEFITHHQSHAETKFNRKDSDEDGFLSFQEATSNRRGEAPDHSDIAEEIVNCVTAIAADDDSLMIPDVTDFASPEDRFNGVDSSADGLLSLEEVQDNAQLKATTTFENMDSDETDEISFEEFQAHSEQRKATSKAVRHCIQELENDAVV